MIGFAARARFTNRNAEGSARVLTQFHGKDFIAPRSRAFLSHGAFAGVAQALVTASAWRLLFPWCSIVGDGEHHLLEYVRLSAGNEASGSPTLTAQHLTGVCRRQTDARPIE